MENVFGMLRLDILGQIQVGNEEGGGLTSLETILSFETLSHSSKAFEEIRCIVFHLYYHKKLLTLQFYHLYAIILFQLL